MKMRFSAKNKEEIRNTGTYCMGDEVWGEEEKKLTKRFAEKYRCQSQARNSNKSWWTPKNVAAAWPQKGQGSGQLQQYGVLDKRFKF